MSKYVIDESDENATETAIMYLEDQAHDWWTGHSLIEKRKLIHTQTASKSVFATRFITLTNAKILRQKTSEMETDER